MADRRLRKEAEELAEDPPEDVSAGPIDDGDLYKWSATIVGPAETPYKDGVFFLSITFPVDYPFKEPTVRFTTPVYHCNIGSTGSVCLGEYAGRWGPELTIRKVLISIRKLLISPNPDDPMDPAIAALFKSNRAEYDLNAQLHAAKHADAPLPASRVVKSAEKR